MVDDPYKVLGVSPSATQDEIKKAYRRKTKEYHPDLHPNDPSATKKMTEINEAYDMLMNPDKYAAKRAQQQQSSSRQNGYSGQYGGYSGNQSGYSGNQGGYSGQQRNSGNYQNAGGWSSDFGFDFDDFFGFGSSYQTASTKPQVEPGDSPRIQQVVNYINRGDSQQALDILFHIPSTGRDARWYYLSSLANHALGNSVQAVDHMQRAAQMDPNNRTYQQLLRQFRQAERTYEDNARGFDMGALNLQKICLGLFAAQFCCSPYSCIRCI